MKKVEEWLTKEARNLSKEIAKKQQAIKDKISANMEIRRDEIRMERIKLGNNKDEIFTLEQPLRALKKGILADRAELQKMNERYYETLGIPAKQEEKSQPLVVEADVKEENHPHQTNYDSFNKLIKKIKEDLRGQ